MYRANFSMAISSWGNMRCPQRTWNPECRQWESMANRSWVILALASPAERAIDDLVPQDCLQLFQVQGKGDPEHAPSVYKIKRKGSFVVGVRQREFLLAQNKSMFSINPLQRLNFFTGRF
jgi:hypothetical protein